MESFPNTLMRTFWFSSLILILYRLILNLITKSYLKIFLKSNLIDLFSLISFFSTLMRALVCRRARYTNGDQLWRLRCHHVAGEHCHASRKLPKYKARLRVGRGTCRLRKQSSELHQILFSRKAEKKKGDSLFYYIFNA